MLCMKINMKFKFYVDLIFTAWVKAKIFNLSLGDV